MDEEKPQTQEGTPVFDAVLTPHRSLGRIGFRNLMVGVALISALAGLRFTVIGAWPVMIFFVVDAGLIYLFFHLNYRAARGHERVTLTYLDLIFARTDPKGRRREWTFSPLWVRLSREDDDEYGTQRLALQHRGMEVEIGRFLTPGEKAEFADALTRALREAREGPRFSDANS